ncbi:hypothetical protein SO802_000229 [Lithocarpus litseifolius]|uniref:Peptidase A1 domain-containing protein n=1 Tax=Lithocarpus litseifolius TaxID=425828 RepID=A0AAW2DV16_9ROSI
MAAALRLYPLLSTLAVILVFSFTEATNSSGFTVDLIHRDSTLSPYYNASDTHFDRLYNAFARSISRANRFKASLQSCNSIQSNVTASNSGEYLMKISLGTPAIDVLGVADTGGDLTWTQCKPCIKCYKQDPPLFDPHHSSTYCNVSCKSKSCINLDRKAVSCGERNICFYNYTYGDNSYTRGDLGVETLTFGSTTGHRVKIPRIFFGCSNNNDNIFDEESSGIIGLGGGPLSLVSQLNKASSKASSNVGNMIIDSGTTYTFLPPEFHKDLVSVLLKTIYAKRVKDPKDVLSPCFRSKGDIDIPIIRAHFTGADVKLKPINTFARMDDDLECFTMIPSPDNLAIFGNLAEINFLVGLNYDRPMYQKALGALQDCDKRYKEVVYYRISVFEYRNTMVHYFLRFTAYKVESGGSSLRCGTSEPPRYCAHGLAEDRQHEPPRHCAHGLAEDR